MVSNVNPNTLKSISNTTKTLVRIAGVIGAVTVIGGGYAFYLNNFWEPDVVVDKVDFNTGIAELTFQKKKIILEGDATYLLGGDWGVRFGKKIENDKVIYKGLELVKKGMVVAYLKK